jgi:hypothetical protein
LYPLSEDFVGARPQLFDYQPSIAKTLAQTFHPDIYRSVAVVPYRLAKVFRLLWKIMCQAIDWLALPLMPGKFPIEVGYLSTCLLLLLVILIGNDITSFWMSIVRELMVLLGGISLGFLLRLTIARQFEMHLDGHRLLITRMLLVLSSGILLALLASQVRPVVSAWAVFASIIGWLEAVPAT